MAETSDSVQPVSTGIIYHSCNDATISHCVQSNTSSADKVIKFCFGYDHLILLKEHAFIQKISNTDDNLFDLCYQQFHELKLPIIDIAFGAKHGLALTEEFQVWSFGDNTSGQLGLGYVGNRTPQKSVSPTSVFRIDHFVQLKQRIISVRCGEYHCCALSQTGDIYTWGSGKYGVLGTKVTCAQPSPRYVSLVDNRNAFISRIACGPYACAAISINGDLYQWGYGQSTPLQILVDEEKDNEHDKENESESTAMSISKSKSSAATLKFKKVSIGNGHTVCLTQCGKVYAWGLAMYGQLGIDAKGQKSVVTPLRLRQFEHVEVTDIECCSLYTVICSRSEIFILGYNDTLFHQKQHFRAYTYPQPQPANICYFGCSRRDFAVLTKSMIGKFTPSVCAAQGSDICITGHGIYVTAFRPTVRYILRDQYILHSACFVTNDLESIQIQCATPDFSQLADFQQAEYPMKIQVSVAIDGKYYTDPVDFYVVQTPSKSEIETFEISPNCADMYGDIRCVITDRSQYISKLTAIPDSQLNDITVKLVAMNHDNNSDEQQQQQQDIILNASISEQLENAIEFVLPPLRVGQYCVLLALDGAQNFVDIQQTFSVYNVECKKCTPEIINLSQFQLESDGNGDIANEIELEMEVDGFVYTDRKNIKLKLKADDNYDNNTDDKTQWFIQDAIYESQSARDIALNAAKLKQEYEAKREEIETAKNEELATFDSSRKAEEEERTNWLAQNEKARKKKKKPADLEEFDKETQRKNEEWQQTVKQREHEQKEIERKYRKQLVLLEKEASRAESARPNEQDTGHGYIQCKLDLTKLAQWKQPCNIQVQITSNGKLFSDLCSISSIHPRISKLSPKLALFSAATNTVKMYIDGFRLDNVDKQDLELSVQDTKVENFEIGKDDADKEESSGYFVAITLSAFASTGEKEIKMKYRDVFEVTATFWAHDAIKIASVTPSVIEISNSESDGVEMQITFSKELKNEYVNGEEMEIEIKANDKCVVLRSAMKLGEENPKECKFNFDRVLLESVGAAKKAQCQISLNKQQWIAAKPLTIK